MGIVYQGLTYVAQFLYGQHIPRGLEVPLIILIIYIAYLLISAGILFYSLKIAGAQLDFAAGFPRAMLTVIIRDVLFFPLLALVFFLPILGAIIALIVWLGILKYMFNLKWSQAFIAWIIAIILPFIVVLLILIPVAIILGAIYFL